MPFIERDAANNIIALFAVKQPGIAEEELPDDHAEVLEFLKPKTAKLDIVNWKAHAILQLRGKMDAVNAAIAALPEPNKTLAAIALDRASVIDRASPTVNALLKGIGMTDADIDQLFIDGNALDL